MRLAACGTILVAILACELFAVEQGPSPADDAESTVVEIPLKEVWAVEMPGTRSLNFSESMSKAGAEIMRVLMASRRSKGETAGPGFAVSGVGPSAIQQARAILVDKEEPAETLRSSETINVVFFSRLSAYYVHLERVERRGATIKVRYRLVPHAERESTAHFAMIPLGLITRGTYTVAFEVASGSEDAFEELGVDVPTAEYIDRIISSGFSFAVDY